MARSSNARADDSGPGGGRPGEERRDCGGGACWYHHPVQRSKFPLRIGLDVQIDHRTFPGMSSVPLSDQILIRRARPAISGSVYKYVDFYFRPDFGQGTTVLYEAYMQLDYFPRANFRVGKFSLP